MTTLKEWMDAQWQAKGLINSGKRNVFVANERGGLKHIRGGSTPTYKSEEQKAYEARFQLYNEKLRPVILAQATVEMRRTPINIYDDKGRYISTKEDGQLPHYTWPKERDGEAGSHEATPAVTSVPRKRVPKAKLEQAAAIIATKYQRTS